MNIAGVMPVGIELAERVEAERTAAGNTFGGMIAFGSGGYGNANALTILR